MQLDADISQTHTHVKLIVTHFSSHSRLTIHKHGLIEPQTMTDTNVVVGVRSSPIFGRWHSLTLSTRIENQPVTHMHTHNTNNRTDIVTLRAIWCWFTKSRDCKVRHSHTATERNAYFLLCALWSGPIRMPSQYVITGWLGLYVAQTRRSLVLVPASTARVYKNRAYGAAST